MKLQDFKIGTEFFTPSGKWRCTDVGTRTIVSIKLDKLGNCWVIGPPGTNIENSFDEDSIEECSLTPYED